MKIFFMLCLGLITFCKNSLCQSACPCCNIIIETPAVSKPTDPGILSATCNTLVVKWKGNANQSYIVSGTYLDPSTNTLLPLADPVSLTADEDYNCTATIPVVAGSTVSWTVKAIQIIDDRTFSSYTLRAMQDYPVPDCATPTVSEKTSSAMSASKEQLVVSNDKLAMYPNPVNDALNMRLSSEYKGNVKLTIVDVSGKAIMVMDVEKQAGDYYNRISVGTLRPGIYFMNVHMQNGKLLTTKFLKN